MSRGRGMFEWDRRPRVRPLIGPHEIEGHVVISAVIPEAALEEKPASAPAQA